MPNICYSYPADVPPGARSVAQPAPPGLRQVPTGTTCFRYPATDCFSYPPGVRWMPTSSSCFRYPADVPGLRRMPASCFRY